MKKFCEELWRIVKFILITGVVNVLFSLANTAFFRSAAAANLPSLSTWLAIASWITSILTVILSTLLNRYFTFRATEPWYIAVPLMLVAVIAWLFLQPITMSIAAGRSAESAMTMSHLLSVLWPILQYLLQRCVIYCHTTDTNGWYRRFHPDTNEEGV